MMERADLIAAGQDFRDQPDQYAELITELAEELEAATPTTKVEIHHAQGGWHRWIYLGGWRGYPTTVKRDSIGREHPYGRREWLVLSCNNSECPARGIVRLDGVIASMEAAHPVPTEKPERCEVRQGDNSPTHLRCRLDAPHPGVPHQWRK